jgi:beta-carotene 3-hydroxylase
VDTLDAVLVALASFALMEPITAATHRFVMHGFGWVLHRSHHRAVRPRGWEANDMFPLLFAAVVCLGLAAGFNVAGLGVLIPVGIGVTAYGVAYGFVHDIAIHRRLGRRPPVLRRTLDRLAAAHAIHHRHGGAPYGMLLPVVPHAHRDLLDQPVGSEASGVAETSETPETAAT